jgi:serine/threonine-protein kinase
LPAKIGRYDVLGALGQGAMGRVLLAHDPVLDRDVAIKILRHDLHLSSDVREGLVVRMRHEARAAARVAHPNLVTLHDMGEDDHVGLYLVFEYVNGPTLKERLLEGRLAPAQAARLALELGGALGFAHAAGILHRDVKPENVMLSPTGGKLADFGIARIPDSTLTHAGGLLGTPAYSAPETFRAGQFSPASDQFSLAATLYEATLGRRAFPGDDAVFVASKITNDAPERLARVAGLSETVDDVFARALAKRAEDRFPSCEAFGAALASELGHSRQTLPTLLDEAYPSEAPELPQPPRKTGHVLLGATVLVILGALVMRTAVRQEVPTETDPGALADAGDDAAAPALTPRPRAPATRPRTGAKHGESDEDAGALPTRALPDGPPQPADLDAGATPEGPTPPAPTPDAAAPSPSSSASTQATGASSATPTAPVRPRVDGGA